MEGVGKDSQGEGGTFAVKVFFQTKYWVNDGMEKKEHVRKTMMLR